MNPIFVVKISTNHRFVPNRVAIIRAGQIFAKVDGEDSIFQCIGLRPGGLRCRSILRINGDYRSPNFTFKNVRFRKHHHDAFNNTEIERITNVRIDQIVNVTHINLLLPAINLNDPQADDQAGNQTPPRSPPPDLLNQGDGEFNPDILNNQLNPEDREVYLALQDGGYDPNDFML